MNTITPANCRWRAGRGQLLVRLHLAVEHLREALHLRGVAALRHHLLDVPARFI